MPAHEADDPRALRDVKEAYEKWLAEPDLVKIIDVRTPEEYLFVGHPAMAWNILSPPSRTSGTPTRDSSR